MHLGDYMDGARSAALARSRIKRKGYVFNWQRTWSREEEDVCRLFWPDICQVNRLLRSRSKTAIRAKARSLGLPVPKVHMWKASELSKLRRLYPDASWDELHEAFPGVSRNSIRHAVQYWKIRKNRKPYKARATS